MWGSHVAWQRPCAPALPGPSHSTLGLKAPDRVQALSRAEMLRAELSGWMQEREVPAERSCPKEGQEELGSGAEPLPCPQGVWAWPAACLANAFPSGHSGAALPGPIQPPDPADMPTQAWSLDSAGLAQPPQGPSRAPWPLPARPLACQARLALRWPEPHSPGASMAIGAAFRPQLWPHLRGGGGPPESLRSLTVTP